jgi:hypothetical protein
LAATYPQVWLDYYYLSGERRALEAVRTLAGSLAGRSAADFAEKGAALSAEQAGWLRARLAAHEAMGEAHAEAARAALGFLYSLPARDLGGTELWPRGLCAPLVRYHRLTGSALAARLIERGMRVYLASRGPAARGGTVERNCYDGCAYAWRLSGEAYFLDRGSALAARSAAARAGAVRIEPGGKLPADLATDAREVLELGTVPYLRAAEEDAETGPLRPASAGY